MEIYNKLSTPPEWAKKQIKGGDIKGYTDINPQWRIQAMTEAFGMCGIGWYYEVTKQWLETSGDTISAFVNINLYVKNGGEWSKPIFGTGGNAYSFMTKTKPSYLKVSDECYKMATTDALSVAMKQLGVGADIYAGNHKSKYVNNPTKQPAKPVKNTAVNIDDNPTFIQGIKDMNDCKTLAELQTTWTKYKSLQKEPKFIEYKDVCKKRLT